MTDHRPIGIAPPAAPHEQDRFTLDGRFQFDSGAGAAVWTLLRDTKGDPTIMTHRRLLLLLLSALWGMWFVVAATVGEEGFAFATDRRGYAFTQRPRFG